MKYSKIAIAVSSCLFLNACLEVEDSSNDELVNTLQAQNEILAQQLEQEADTVAITGLVINAKDDEAVSSASITVKKGAVVVAENVSVTEGIFELNGLSPNSDLEIIISSADEDFMQRVFYVNTGYSASGEAFKDFGTFQVSEAVELEIIALKTDDGLPLGILEFEASSVSGSGSTALSYKHVSTFDETAGVYNISIPRYLSTTIYANLDTDQDGSIDYTPEDYSYSSNSGMLYIYAANTLDEITFYLSELEEESEVEYPEVEYRVSIVDESGTAIESAEMFIDDDRNDNLISAYDEVSGQHVVTGLYDGSLSIEIPAFTDGDVNYQSASISIYDNSDEVLNINPNNTNSNTFYQIPKTDSVEIAISLYELTNPTTNLEVVLDSNPAVTEDASYSVFYSQAVRVPELSATLYNRYANTITKGDDSSDDLILPGTTLIEGETFIPLNSSMSLNNTKVTLTPVESLTSGETYTYDVSRVEILSSEILVDVGGDNVSFTVPADTSEIFDINDVRLDNENYTTGGTVITALNTAGEASTSSDGDRRVYWYFPTTINSLENFTIRQVSVTEEGVSYIDVDNFTVVDSGSIYGSQVSLVALASNESIETESVYRSVISSTALTDTDKIYRYNSTYNNVSDDTTAAENSISFEYAYETNTGEVVTGSLTLPVL